MEIQGTFPSCQLMRGVLRNNAIHKFMVVDRHLFVTNGFFSFPEAVFRNAEILFSFGGVS